MEPEDACTFSVVPQASILKNKKHLRLPLLFFLKKSGLVKKNPSGLVEFIASSS